ncbi:HepT-like ribonuclease domain-containing protein [Rhizobium paknamense]|uniref:Uncharacterized protein with HEPN domain n=1 Tax=Rhizobium paknamense TaxID=1206817 RepID=A0ABU0I853_9HYPH|nr:HepT-like ribonuclease domain-containing protein [Rhizobium paknamense]MDQ0454412.1 uncharacterized protein with HEPN domain [Rhizobium paknamense]
MKKSARLPDHLKRMISAVDETLSFISHMTEEEFRADSRTQMAVPMGFVLLGEEASRIQQRFPDFVQDHPAIPWMKIRGMRNFIAHEYYQLDFAVVWQTLLHEMPKLSAQLKTVLSEPGFGKTP